MARLTSQGTSDVYVKGIEAITPAETEGEQTHEAHGGRVQVTGPGDSFGELALMYTSPRAATVMARTDMVLWGVDRQTFRAIIMSATVKKRSLHGVNPHSPHSPPRLLASLLAALLSSLHGVTPHSPPRLSPLCCSPPVPAHPRPAQLLAAKPTRTGRAAAAGTRGGGGQLTARGVGQLTARVRVLGPSVQEFLGKIPLMSTLEKLEKETIIDCMEVRRGTARQGKRRGLSLLLKRSACPP